MCSDAPLIVSDLGSSSLVLALTSITREKKVKDKGPKGEKLLKLKEEKEDNV